jgi:hypothetical protein
MSYQLYFIPFKHQASNDVYSYKNTSIHSPITLADAEFKEVWHDTPSTYPDLLLWIGTGIADESLAQLEKADTRTTSTSDPRKGKSRLSIRKQKKAFPNSAEEYHDQVWDDYLNSLPLDAPESNFKRFNVRVPEPPAADDIGSIDAFENAVRKGIDGSEISKLASRIFASFFYFDGKVEETPSKELFLRGELHNSALVCASLISGLRRGNFVSDLGRHAGDTRDWALAPRWSLPQYRVHHR